MLGGLELIREFVGENTICENVTYLVTWIRSRFRGCFAIEVRVAAAFARQPRDCQC
jgi:hypothetical protein